MEKLDTLTKTHKIWGETVYFCYANKNQKDDRHNDKKQETKFEDFGFENQITKTS